MPTDETREPHPNPPTVAHNEPPLAAPLSGTMVQTPDEAARVAAAFGVSVIPGYEIIRKLGEGGMGAVYLALDQNLKREVALKTLRAVDSRPEQVARFWAEAEVMAAVRHPHVVQVYELGKDVTKPFIAMEYLDGGSLSDKLKDNTPMPPRDAAVLVEKIARGVAAAHELGIVHRDLKPGNVLMSSDGEPKVADFGLAKRNTNELTQTQALMGTPAYMAPEQAAGRAKFVGPPADVWALGVVLYECVAAAKPFEADTVQSLLSQITSSEPTTLRTRVRGLPRDLDTIVSKCLSKEPEHRYATAGELADDLTKFVRGEPITARPVGMVERAIRWARREPAAASAYCFSSLAVLLAILVFIIGGLWQKAEGAKGYAETARDQLADEKMLTEAARDDALKQKGIAEGLFKDADFARGDALRLKSEAEDAKKEVERQRDRIARIEYGRTIQVAYLECLGNNQNAAYLLLDGIRADLRGWEWHYVRHLCNYGLVSTFKGHKVRASASFDSEGKRIVTGSLDGSVKVWSLKTGAEVTSFQAPTGVNCVAFSPDDKRIIAGVNDGTAHVWVIATGQSIILRGHSGAVTSASFNVDGSQIVTGSFDNTAKVWDAKSGTTVLTLKGHTSSVVTASYNRDGTRIVTASHDETARVWDSKSGAEVRTLRKIGRSPTATISPDGTRIVTTSRQSDTPKIWDV